jgi:acyl-CoA thioesterase
MSRTIMTSEALGMDKERLLEEIRQLEDDTDWQLIAHTLASLKKAKEKTMHYIGLYMGIDLYDEGGPRLWLGPHNANTYGVAQGGVLYTFADVVIGYAILNRLTPPQKVLTLELKMNFIRPGIGEYLTAETEFLHWGRRTVVAACHIKDSTGNIVASALGTFFITAEGGRANEASPFRYDRENGR